MTEDAKSPGPEEAVQIDLKDPALAAFWAWLWPGAGHFYQGRRTKGVLLMVCILGTYFSGLVMGGGHVVYASWTETDWHLPYVCQIGVGLPALPALVQSYRVLVEDKEPWFDGFMAPPVPQPVVLEGPKSYDTLAKWHDKYGFMWEMGTLYTMVAGLLNVLAIYDAYAGPVFTSTEKESEKRPPDGEKDKK